MLEVCKKFISSFSNNTHCLEWIENIPTWQKELMRIFQRPTDHPRVRNFATSTSAHHGLDGRSYEKAEGSAGSGCKSGAAPQKAAISAAAAIPAVAVATAAGIRAIPGSIRPQWIVIPACVTYIGHCDEEHLFVALWLIVERNSV